MRRPKEGEYGAFYQHYIELTRGANHLQNLSDSTDMLLEYLMDLPADRQDYAYAEGKWSIRQMLQHLVDTDLVFNYRALWLAREGGGDLPGYNHDRWAEQSAISLPPWPELIDQFRSLRRYSLGLYHGFSEEELESKGKMNEQPIVLRSIPFIMAGHSFHHLQVLKERYAVAGSQGN